MISKNNNFKKIAQSGQAQHHFSIRKLSIGATSVLVGTSLYLGFQSSSVHAAELKETSNNEITATEKDSSMQESQNSTKEVTITKNATPLKVDNNKNTATLSVKNEADAAKNNSSLTSSTNIDSENKSTQTQEVSFDKNSSQNVETTTYNVPLETTKSFEVTQSENSNQLNLAKDTSAKETSNKIDPALFLNSFISMPSNYQMKTSNNVDITTYNPDFNYTDGYAGNGNFSFVPSYQYAYAQTKDNKTGKVFTYTTDKNNPGQTLYFYENGSLVASVGAQDSKRNWQFYTDATNGYTYQGGTYNYLQAIKSKGNYQFIRTEVTGKNSSSPVTNGISGSVKNNNGDFSVIYYNGTHYNPLFAQSGGVIWRAVSSLTPQEVTQNVYYVNADTGEVMSVKQGTALAGQHYDLRDAGPENIEYKGQTLELIPRDSNGNYDTSKLPENLLDKVITKNNGVNITLRDMIDAPLTGEVNQYRKGGIYISAADYQGQLAYIAQVTDTQGTEDLNTYVLHSNDVRTSDGKISFTGRYQTGSGNSAGRPSLNTSDDPAVIKPLSTPALKPNNIAGGSYGETAAARYGTTEYLNQATPGNLDVVFLYKAPAVQKADVSVEYVDADNYNQEISGYPKVTINGEIGGVINYTTMPTISALENQGYVLVNDGFQNAGTIFTNNNNGKTYQVIFRHGVQQNQVSKNIDLNVNYVNSDGTQFTGDIPANAHQEVTFEGTAYIDKTNGQMVNAIKQGNDWIVNTADKSTPEISWTIKAGEKNSFDAVTSPQETGYHATSVTPSQYADGVNVKAITGLTQDTTSPINVTVTYSPNGEEVKNPETVVPTQTVKFVDSEGNELQRANIQTGSPFIYSGDTYDKVTGQEIRKGSWNRESYTFKTVNAPVIEGYVARQKSAGGLTATPTNPDVEAEIVYEKVGKIIPVTPDGKEIPGAPQPKYPNDPNDPTAVVPNEPTPVIPGYTTPTKTVTPEDPTKDTPVVYTQDSVDGSVTYIDDTTGKTLSTVDLKGTIGEKITYTTTATIKDYEDKGYVFVSSDFDNGNEVFEKTGNKFEVHLKHGTVPVNPQNPGKPGKPINPNDPEGPKYPRGTAKANLYKTIRRTIQFINEKGKSLGSQVQSVNFSASGVLDKVTGEWVEPLTWDQDQKTIAQIALPSFNGYKVKSISRDGVNNNAVGAIVVTPKTMSSTVTVTYESSTDRTGGLTDSGVNLMSTSFLAIPNTFSSMANNLKQNIRSLFNTQLFWSPSKTQNLFKLF